jgi:hypothetical protein
MYVQPMQCNVGDFLELEMDVTWVGSTLKSELYGSHDHPIPLPSRVDSSIPFPYILHFSRQSFLIYHVLCIDNAGAVGILVPTNLTSDEISSQMVARIQFIKSKPILLPGLTASRNDFQHRGSGAIP